MKIFISSDMEGTAGVADWSQCLAGEGEYEYYRGLLQAEVNAAIEGAASAGADEFLVNDSHSKMINLRPDALARSARYLSGRHKPLYMMQGLDPSFDAAFFVSYHGSMSASSPLSHTYNPRAIAEVMLNGVVVDEAARVSPGVHRAVVKTAVSRFASNSLHPADACALIRDQAAAAIAELDRSALPAIELPATLTVNFRNADLADMATWISGVRRGPGTSVTMTDDDPIALFQRFICTVVLTRDIAE
jgi:D-amino peptidase